MGNYIFKLLSFLDREKTIFKTVCLFLLISFLGFEIGINTHETSYSSNILILEGLNQLKNSFRGRFRADVQKNTYLRVKLSAETLKKP